MQKRILYFLTIANCLSFSKAAKQLFISQQALTRQIALLEEELGVKLFVRSTRSVHLTEAGKICRDEFTRISQDMSNAVNRIRSATFANTSSLTIGFQSSFSRKYVITPVMKSIQQFFPDVNFKLKLYDFRKMRYSLLDGECDLCIAISSDWKNWTHIKAGILRQLAFKIVTSRDHPLARQSHLDWQELGKYQWIQAGNTDVSSQNKPSWYSQVPCSSTIEAGDLLTALAYVEIGQGFSCQPAVFLGMENPDLKTFEIPLKEAKLDIIYAYSDTMQNPLVLALSRHLKQCFAANYFPEIR